MNSRIIELEQRVRYVKGEIGIISYNFERVVWLDYTSGRLRNSKLINNTFDANGKTIAIEEFKEVK